MRPHLIRRTCFEHTAATRSNVDAWTYEIHPYELQASMDVHASTFDSPDVFRAHSASNPGYQAP